MFVANVTVCWLFFPMANTCMIRILYHKYCMLDPV